MRCSAILDYAAAHRDSVFGSRGVQLALALTFELAGDLQYVARPQRPIIAGRGLYPIAWPLEQPVATCPAHSDATQPFYQLLSHSGCQKSAHGITSEAGALVPVRGVTYMYGETWICRVLVRPKPGS